MAEWKETRQGSFFIENKNDAFFVSYNSHEVPNPIDNILVMFGVINRENKNRPETALVILNGKSEGRHRYLILFGDHREQYGALIDQGLEACIKYFEDNIMLMTQTSDDLPAMTKH